MYKCEIYKSIWSDTEKTDLYEILFKCFELPFPPYIGLAVIFEKFNSGEILSVTWNTDSRIFNLKTSDETPWIDDDGHIHTAEEIASHYITRSNWEALR